MLDRLFDLNKINVTISNFSEELRSKYENDWKELTGS